MRGGIRRYFTDAAAALLHDPTAYAGGLPPEQQATLVLFADWFKETFPRVEAVRQQAAEMRQQTFPRASRLQR